MEQDMSNIENAISGQQQNTVESESHETASIPGMYPDGNIKPRPQNRKVVIMAFLKVMPGGLIKRVEQVFDAPIAFSIHREMINTINEWRLRVFGEDGKLYETKNVDMPGADQVVQCLIVNSKSGKIISEKVFDGVEAAAYLAKVRADLENNKIKPRHQFGETSADGFHLLQDAMNSAAEKRTEIAVNN